MDKVSGSDPPPLGLGVRLCSSRMSDNPLASSGHVPLAYRVKAVLSGLFGVPFLFVALAIIRNGNLSLGGRLGAGFFFLACAVPFGLLALRLWRGDDLRPVTAGMARCGGCRRPVPTEQLRPMWQALRTALPWAFGGTQGEADKLYCRRCSTTQSVGALFLFLLFATAFLARFLR